MKGRVKMQYKQLGNSDLKISQVSFGTWAIGGSWGEHNDQEAMAGLLAAIEQGVNFFDTADVYGNGHSEQLLNQLQKATSTPFMVATKFGRQGAFDDPHNYTRAKITQYCEDSLRRLGREAIDLYQIHCAPLAILKDTDVFPILDDLKQAGKIRYYGVSVENDEEGLFVMNQTNATSLQVIFNMLRQKPLKELFPTAEQKQVGILARVPLASGLLTGKYDKNSRFAADDHRHFNRDGQSFNVGETFGGLPFEVAIELIEQLGWIKEGRIGMAQAALKWILQQSAVTTVIPGFKTVKQVEQNLASQNVPDFTNEELQRLSDFYWEKVHQHIRGTY